MKAVILAAGEGSRMRPLTYTRPKVMLPVANRPLLEHLIVEAREAGVDEFVLIVGYHDEQVRQYFGDGSAWSVSVSYASQRKQLGTADAVRMVEGAVKGKFLLMNGDVIVKKDDLRVLVSRDENTISVIEVADPRGLGMVQVVDGKVKAIFEKVENPPTNLANTGVYLLTSEIFRAISLTPTSPRGEYEITTSLQILVDSGLDVGFHKLGYWMDLSYPWNLLGANEKLLADLNPTNLGTIENNAVIHGPVAVGRGTTIRSGSYISGPVIIGEDCEIGPNCYIRPSTAIGDRCHIGAAVEIKNSIIMSGSKVPHLSYVGDSVIGQNCNLGAGTKIANLRLDEKEVTVGRLGTGRRKFGAVLGDGVKTGINASINIGTMIGNGAFIGPGALASGIISPGSRVL